MRNKIILLIFLFEKKKGIINNTIMNIIMNTYTDYQKNDENMNISNHDEKHNGDMINPLNITTNVMNTTW